MKVLIYQKHLILVSTRDPKVIETGSDTLIPKVIKGREGTPIYLPNIFQTNVLYGGRTGLSNPSVGTTAVADISNILSAHRKNSYWYSYIRKLYDEKYALWNI